MDLKRIKKNEQIDKKCFNDKIKDRGDLKTVTTNDKVKKDIIPNNRVSADGDSRKVSTNQRLEKTKQNVVTKLPINEYKIKPSIMITEAEKEQLCKRPAYLKRVRDRYTTRLKTQTPNVPANPVKKEEPKIITVKAEHATQKENGKKVSVCDHVKSYIEVVTQTNEKNSSSSEGTKDKKDQIAQQKKPIIKTITTKNKTTRVYKAVTFGEQRQKPTPLQIKIPNDSMQKKPSKITDISSMKSILTVSRINIHEKIDHVRKKKLRKQGRKFRHVPSRDWSYEETRSPPTEVARWAPSSVDRHTKPYYEAWVDTTLAAVLKCKNRERLLKDEKFMLQTFRRAMDRPVSPELIYSNFNDEIYTGRIKITQR